MSISSSPLLTSADLISRNYDEVYFSHILGKLLFEVFKYLSYLLDFNATIN